MKTLISLSLIFLTLGAKAQVPICDYIKKTVFDKSSTDWTSPNYSDDHNTILFSFRKVLYFNVSGTHIYLCTGCFSDYKLNEITNVNVTFEDGDELTFSDVSLSQTCDEAAHRWTNTTSIELNGPQLYRFKTKKVTSFTVALHYTDGLPPYFKTNTMAFANCMETAQ